MAYQLTRDDLIAHLREQVDFLRASAAGFDKGTEAEAKRLAIALRVLLHNTPDSSSVLEQLGVQQALEFVNTTPTLNPEVVMALGLVMMMGTPNEIRYVAPLDNLSPGRQLPPKHFDAWWNDPVTRTRSGDEFSRKSYVLGLANKEGGGHVDPKLNEKYARLTRHNALGYMYTIGDGVDVPLGTPAPAAVRQITHEVLKTLEALPYLKGA